MMTGPHKIHQNLAQTMVWAPGLEVKVDKSKFIKYMHNTAQVRDWLLIMMITGVYWGLVNVNVWGFKIGRH